LEERGGGGKGLPARKADNLTAICEPTVQNMWEPRRLTTIWASTICYRDSFTFLNIGQHKWNQISVSNSPIKLICAQFYKFTNLDGCKTCFFFTRRFDGNILAYIIRCFWIKYSGKYLYTNTGMK
jgi:hypothetical protein